MYTSSLASLLNVDCMFNPTIEYKILGCMVGKWDQSVELQLNKIP